MPRFNSLLPADGGSSLGVLAMSVPVNKKSPGGEICSSCFHQVVTEIKG